MARILIVEDEGILAYTTELELKAMGHEVIGVADNGRDAVALAKREKPDLILMDIVLKGSLNGIEASGVICGGNGCKIIYMTAHTDKATLDAARCSRHVGFLYKPFEPWQLRAAVNKALGYE